MALFASRPLHVVALLALLLSAAVACGPRFRHGGRAPVEARGGRMLRVVSFNVARDLGLFAARHSLLRPLLGTPPDLLSSPELTGARVVALQEVCSLGSADVVRAWLWRLPGSGWQARFVRHDRHRRGACGEGQLIAVRGQILASGAVPLPHIRAATRVASWVTFRHAGRLVRLWNVHLNTRITPTAPAARSSSGRTLSPAEARRRQLGPVLAQVRAFRHAHPKAVALVVGDFNTRTAVEPVVRAASQVLRSALPPGVITHMLGWPLDWIWYLGAELQRWAVVSVRGSDHDAVVATMAL